MYHTQEINQAPVQKNLHPTRFSQQHFPSDHYTPYEHDLVRLLEAHSYLKLTNEALATLLGCSPRTVTRITNSLHDSGVITKHRSHLYDINSYTLNSHRIVVDHKNKKVCSDVTPKNKIFSSPILDSLSRSLCVVSYEGYTDSKIGVSHPVPTSHNFKIKKEEKVNEVQKRMILNNRHDPRIKTMLDNPSIKEQIITPTIQLLTDILSLDEKEQFKLVAFSEDTIDHTFAKVASMVHTNTLPKKSNRMEWLLEIATDYCKDNGIKPNWRWYYDLCDITGMDTKTTPKPLFIKHTQQNKKINNHEPSTDQQIAKLTAELKAREERLSLYGGSVLDKKTIERLNQEIKDKEPQKGKLSGYERILKLPLDERIIKLRSELAIHQERYACYTGPEYMKGLLGRMIERTQFDLNEAETIALSRIRSSDEKQDLLCEYNPNPLESCNA
jgi:DNA-binding MarR family transcriptional regulator